MNRFIYQIAQDGHLTFRQKSRLIIMQIFGHEALIDVADLRENSHCFVFNADIYHLGPIKTRHIAYRKLFNPFKYLEFAVVFPLEIINWSLTRHLIVLSNYKSKLLDLYLNITFFVISKPLNIIINIALAIPRRILAPIRYIVRPTIELAKTQPKTLGIILGITLLIAAVIAASIFTGGIPLAIGGATLAGVILAKTAFVAGAAAVCWSALLKIVTGIEEIVSAIKRASTAPPKALQLTEIFQSTSTEKITESLHAINPKLTLVNKASEQDSKQTFALMTGTEAIFYKPKANIPVTSPSATVPARKRCC